jgi:hypothetical protein
MVTKRIMHSPNPMWTVNPGSRAAASSAAGVAACLKFSEYPGRSFDDDGIGISELNGKASLSILCLKMVAERRHALFVFEACDKRGGTAGSMLLIGCSLVRIQAEIRFGLVPPIYGA